MLEQTRIKVLLFLIIFVLLFSGCTSSTPKFGIIFSANLDESQDIYHMYGSDFQTIEQLTFSPIDNEQYIVATGDGKQILFHVPSPGIERIQTESLSPPDTYAHTYLLETATKKITELNDTLGIYPSIPLVWHQNEIEIFLKETSSRKIYLANLDKMKYEELEITHEYHGSDIGHLNYSYDGEQIAYEEWHPFSGAPPNPIVHSYVYDFSSKIVIHLIGDELADCYNPEWSPVRKQILLYCTSSKDNGSPQVRLLKINLPQESISAIEEIGVYPICFKPVWSPDGEQIAMVCRDNNKNTGIFLTNFDGSNYREILANIPYYTPYLLWSPDGKQLIYSGGENTTEKRHIYLVNIDGTNNHTITKKPANYENLFVYEIGR